MTLRLRAQPQCLATTLFSPYPGQAEEQCSEPLSKVLRRKGHGTVLGWEQHWRLLTTRSKEVFSRRNIFTNSTRIQLGMQKGLEHRIIAQGKQSGRDTRKPLPRRNVGTAQELMRQHSRGCWSAAGPGSKVTVSSDEKLLWVSKGCRGRMQGRGLSISVGCS